MPKSQQGVNHSQQLEDMRRVVPFRSYELQALVHDRMLQALVILLRQDRRDGDAADIRRKHRLAGRIEREQHWSGGEESEDQLRSVEASLPVHGRGPHETCSRAT